MTLVMDESEAGPVAAEYPYAGGPSTGVMASEALGSAMLDGRGNRETLGGIGGLSQVTFDMGFKSWPGSEVRGKKNQSTHNGNIAREYSRAAKSPLDAYRG